MKFVKTKYTKSETANNGYFLHHVVRYEGPTQKRKVYWQPAYRGKLLGLPMGKRQAKRICEADSLTKQAIKEVIENAQSKIDTTIARLS